MDTESISDTDWSITGPLIERYGIWLIPYKDLTHWTAWINSEGTVSGEGSSPLIAVRNLIVSMKELGLITQE